MRCHAGLPRAGYFAVAVSCAALSGCAPWRRIATPVPAPAGAPPAAVARGDWVRVSRVGGGRRVELAGAAVAGDSLVGWRGRRRVALPLAEVARLERRDGRTVDHAYFVYAGVLFAVTVYLRWGP